MPALPAAPEPMKAWLAWAALALAGCAPLPAHLPPRPDRLAPEANRAVSTLARASDLADASWPRERWWTGYGDSGLDRLIERALRNNPDIAAATDRLRVANEDQRLVTLGAGVNYQADASLLGERLTANGIFPPPIGGSSFHLGDASLNVSYSLDWWGRNRDLIRSAIGDTRATRAEAAAARLVIAASVADAYFAWADIRTRLVLARKLADLRREALKLAQSRLGNGLDSLMPVREAKQQLALTKDRVRTLEYLDRSWRYRLAALTGVGPDRANTLPAPRLPASQPPLPAHLPLDWLARRPDVTALRWRTEAASARSAAARADFYPNVDLTLLAGLQSESLTRWLAASSLNGTAGPAVHIPWFNTHTLQARLGAREAEYAAAVEAYNHDVLHAAEQVADGYALLASLKQRASIQSRALDEARQIQALQQSRYRNGLTDRIEIVDADIKTLIRRLSVTEIRGARLRASVALYQALGGGYGPPQDGDHGTPE